MGFDGPIDINHLAIHSAMDLYQVRNRQRCFEKVVKLWWVLREREGMIYG